MHSVCELHSFRRASAAAGLSEDDVTDIITFLADNPTAGEEISGTGGCRKLRVAGRGKGKSGGYRVITFFTGELLPVFLITAFSKGEKSDLTNKERNGLKGIAQAIKDEYKVKVRQIG